MSTPDSERDDWQRMSYYVLAELKRMDQRLENHGLRMQDIQADLVSINAKALIIGGVASALFTLILAAAGWVIGRVP